MKGFCEFCETEDIEVTLHCFDDGQHEPICENCLPMADPKGWLEIIEWKAREYKKRAKEDEG